MKTAKTVLCMFMITQIFSATAQNSSVGVNLPSTNFSAGNDRVRSADGVECSTHVGPRDKWLEVGTFAYSGASYATNSSFAGSNFYTSTNPTNSGSVGVYAKMVFNLDKQRPVVDCSQLYALEIQRLQKEVESLILRAKLAPSFEK